ncbi:hypothetical protein [Microvirga pudoricolor]|uniref:hypothetical protein n=1 Tax=Microvirga pudoricolor TaxID=2778729 RepID=UPI0019525AA0|nr:hypothetical protein [Microvirga pudoricolor]MBM6594557.1 hypothetical protein [Microvirga pudoricolor]
MRDILTVLASIVILILAAAVAAPPFIDWEAHRSTVDGMISRAAGVQAHTEGRISVRLLPSPRLRFDRLRLGADSTDNPTLTADFVSAEFALPPLLRGEVRFTETRVGRADIRVPVSSGGGWRLPPDIVSGSGRAREWAIENLTVAQFLLTTRMTDTGRTDQFYAESVRIEGQKLIGPWRVEGVTAKVPFRFTTGELAQDKTVQVKLTGGGDEFPRFDIDARLSLNEGNSAPTVPLIAGKARLLFGPPAQVAAAGIPIPIAIDTEFKTAPDGVVLSPLQLEAGEGGASLRLTGEGTIGLADPKIALRLEGRRLDADSFILSSNGQDFKSRLSQWTIPSSRIPVALDLKLDSIGLGQDDLSNAVAKVTVEKGIAKVERFEFMAPGDTRVAMQGEAGLETQGGVEGRVAIASAASDRLARYLDRINIRSPFLKVLDGRPFEAASDVSVAYPIVSLSRLRVKTGDATLTGNVRYTEPEGRNRGRLEAQVAVQGLNLDQLPQVSSVFEATQNLDVGFILDARDVRAGNRPGIGRISARVLSDGPALLVETLDIVNLAGANAKVSGRIAPDGSGRIAGKVTAQRAAPVIDLLGSVWIGGLSRMVPYFIREGDLNLDVVSERVAPPRGSAELRLRTTANGTVAGGSFTSQVDSVDGRTQNLDARLATDNTGRWVGRADAPLLRKASSISLKGARVPSGLFNVTLSGDVSGVQIATTRPFTLSSGDDVVDSGEADLTSADVTPFLSLLGDGAGVSPPVPLKARVGLGRNADSTVLDISGTVAGNPVQGRLQAVSRSDVSGEVSLDRLSLPWLVTALSLNAPASPNATALWSTARFGQSGRLFSGGQVAVRAKTLELGRGLLANNARFDLAASTDGIALRGLDATLGGGRLTGSANVTRQGALASIVGEGALRDVPLAAVVGPTPFQARLSGEMKFGAAAESLAGLVSNLGGSGEWRITNLSVPSGDPAAFDRALRRLLGETEPLVEGRAEAVLGEELGRAALTSANVTTTAALVGGLIRFSPFVIDTRTASWQGAVAYDLKNLSLDARGTFVSKTAPPGWTGAPPSTGLNWRGSFATPVREIDAGPFRNGLAAIVLKRELEKIEAFEKAAAERQRQIEAQEAERRRKAAEEAARQARLREEAERARIEAERIQSEQQRSPEAPAPGQGQGQPQPGPGAPPFTMPPSTPSLNFQPPAATPPSPGG